MEEINNFEREFENQKTSRIPVLASLFVGLIVIALIAATIVNFAKKGQDLAQSDKANPTQELKKQAELLGVEVVGKTQPPTKDSKLYGAVSSVNQENIIEFLGFVERSALNDEMVDGSEKGKVYTFIIPQNQAFDKSQDAIKQLLDRNDASELQALVKRHVVLGDVSSLPQTGLVNTLSGEQLFIDKSAGTVMFGGITARFVEVSGNSIVVDAVLY